MLIISARKGEFETGFERGGQTTEHAVLARTLGVSRLIVAVNKMDDPSVEWKQTRYTHIQERLLDYLTHKVGFPSESVNFIPISGLNGDNVMVRKNSPSWVTGPTLFELFDSLDVNEKAKNAALADVADVTPGGGEKDDLTREIEAELAREEALADEDAKPLRIPMLDGYKDMGALMATGKIEQGVIKPMMKCIIQPVGKSCIVQNVIQTLSAPNGETESRNVTHANKGENITLRIIKNSEEVGEEDLRKGYVLCPLYRPLRAVKLIKCEFKLIELVEERPVLTNGYACIIHMHTATEECEITKLLEVKRANSGKIEKRPQFAKQDDVLTCIIRLNLATSVDTFINCEKLGRFTLRDEGMTIGIGRILELPPTGKN